MASSTPQVDTIMSDIRADKYSILNIAKKNNVTAFVVERLFVVHMNECKQKENVLMNNGKQEAYQTEEEALAGLPTYTATHHEMIKPIREDWKLFSDEGTIKTLYK